jgi:hypothetical protein
LWNWALTNWPKALKDFKPLSHSGDCAGLMKDMYSCFSEKIHNIEFQGNYRAFTFSEKMSRGAAILRDEGYSMTSLDSDGMRAALDKLSQLAGHGQLIPTQ